MQGEDINWTGYRWCGLAGWTFRNCCSALFRRPNHRSVSFGFHRFYHL